MLAKETLKKDTDKTFPQRTIQQNKALHLLFRILADQLNDQGLYLQKVIKLDFETPWSEILVKEVIWRQVQQAFLAKNSTTELRTNEIDKIFEVISKRLGEKFGIELDFPSIESVIYGMRKK